MIVNSRKMYNFSELQDSREFVLYTRKLYKFCELQDSREYPKTVEYLISLWIGFTVVANLALTASGVGRESYPDSPGGHIMIMRIIMITTIVTL